MGSSLSKGHLEASSVPYGSQPRGLTWGHRVGLARRTPSSTLYFYKASCFLGFSQKRMEPAMMHCPVLHTIRNRYEKLVCKQPNLRFHVADAQSLRRELCARHGRNWALYTFKTPPFIHLAVSMGLFALKVVFQDQASNRDVGIWPSKTGIAGLQVSKVDSER